ncbi:tetratricopeptide (TPR) repeat protein [Haloferula luteola]|uniref:Tetratricopeptide (TPR) repeat protein n=1 Tax=Haloferula luteola TaxID=595692 RepID=A0A840VM97_9BACT|nr:tetratricopeptide repeat protein [Haloferula luteola]MBB5353751.1 tetratricopeptide (TPR) repeat protein [Haloferula luteola]
MQNADFPLSEIHLKILKGHMLDAWDQAQATGILLTDWPHGDARRVAARLARSLGDSRLGFVLDGLNWRADRQNPKWFFHSLNLRSAWLSIPQKIEEISNHLEAPRVISPTVQADLLAMRGHQYACLRDFSPAHRDLNLALELAPHQPWIHVMHSAVLEKEDRYEDAYSAAKEAIALQPNYAAAVYQLTDNLIHLGRDEEAIQILERASSSTQNAGFPIRLQLLYSEREDHQRALDCIRIAEERSPLANDSLRKWFAGRRADFYLLEGDTDRCIEWSERNGNSYYLRTARKLLEPGLNRRKRVRLDVPFIRQHSMTCAPATLASLAAFWKRPVDHLTIAEAICHEGTPWHKERHWAEEHGFHTVEFRLTNESLHALIDRGVPFTLSTQAATSAHLQACIGYDDRTGLILVRDPTDRHYGEMSLDQLIKNHPINGPRGMVMVPREEKALLDGIILPDCALYDAYHDLLVVLDSHERLPVEAAMAALRAIGGDAPLVHDGSERVATWKDDASAGLNAIDRQLAFAPDHPPTLLRKASTLQKLRRWQDLRDFLEDIVRQPQSDPIFNSELGELLMEDARQLHRAERFLRKAVRQRKWDAGPYSSLAWCRAKQQRHAEAAVLHRISACLNASFDPYSRNYFNSCRIVRREEEAIEFLRARTQRFGNKSSETWIQLANALNDLNRHDDAAVVLQEGAAIFPEMGGYALKSGAMMATWGEPHRSQGLEWMEAARGKTPEHEWLAETARIAGYLGDRSKSIRCWKSLTAMQPRRMDAWRGLASQLADLEGLDSTLKLLDQATKDHPEVLELWTLKAEYLKGTKRGPLEALDHALDGDPGNLWARRERAIYWFEAGEPLRAQADAQDAVDRHPWDPKSYGTLAWLQERENSREAAAENYRHAIQLDVDYTFAAYRLLSLFEDQQAKHRELAFLRLEMDRQVSNGSILLPYQELAWPLLEPAELLDQLHTFCSQRPDLWQTWAATIHHTLQMGDDDLARTAALELTERFPLLPRAWLEFAKVYRAARQPTEEVKATARAIELSPGWDDAARQHAEILETLGRTQDAVEVLTKAAELEPLEGANHGCLADLLHRLNRTEQALDVLLAGLRLCPFYGWGWSMACKWAGNLQRRQEVIELLQSTSLQKDHHPKWWPIAADTWIELGDYEAALSSVQQGLLLQPKNVLLRDKLAQIHFLRKDNDLAFAACSRIDGESETPINLRGRRAWIFIHSGQPLKGAEEMKLLLQESPNNSWALDELATFFEDRSDWQELRDHSQRWLRIDPQNTRALACLGISELNLKNLSGARTAYTRAHALDPSYSFVARQLLHLQLDAHEFDDAAATLASLRHFSPSPWNTKDAIDLQLRQGDHPAAFQLADSLIQDSTANFEVFNEVEDLFSKHQLTHRYRAWIRNEIGTPPIAAPGALANWIGTLTPALLPTTGYKRLLKEPLASPSRNEAWQALLRYCTGSKLKKKTLLWSKRHRAELHTPAALWAATGRAFLSSGLCKAGVAWMADWRSRPDDLDTSSFVNLAALYDSHPGDTTEQFDHSLEVRLEGLRRFPEDVWQAQALRAGLALQLACSGKIEEARELVKNLEEDRCTDYYCGLGNGARAILAASDGNESEARRQLEQALQKFGNTDRLGASRHRQRLVQAVASSLPWTKGRARALRKHWDLTPEPQKKPLWERDIKLPAWAVVTLVILLARACSRFLEMS